MSACAAMRKRLRRNDHNARRRTLANKQPPQPESGSNPLPSPRSLDQDLNLTFDYSVLQGGQVPTPLYPPARLSSANQSYRPVLQSANPCSSTTLQAGARQKSLPEDPVSPTPGSSGALSGRDRVVCANDQSDDEADDERDDQADDPADDPAENTATYDTGHQPDSCGQASYLGESGYMPVFTQLRSTSNARPIEPLTIDIHYTISPLNLTLQVSYADAFTKSCYCFCPILDKATLKDPKFSGSLLLQQALAMVGTIIQPSLLHIDDPASHYEKARILLHRGVEPNPLATLVAVMFFYWWTTCPPNVVSMNGSWWWTGVAIRQAQELGFHREPKPDQRMRPGETVGLRRRIWWTLFARERLTSLCQGRPPIINTEDCDVRAPSTDDFPDPADPRASIFIQWVRLCSIIGRVGDQLRRSPQANGQAHGLLNELKVWVNSLPSNLQLPFASYPTEGFNPDISQLHLPYLSSLTLLHMKKSSRSVPTAHSIAILAASCTARIFEDLLTRGSLKFLQGMAGWHIAIALLALLHARQTKSLELAAVAQFNILRVALKEMAQRWPSAGMYDKGIDKLLAAQTQLEQSDLSADTDPITALDRIQPPHVVSHPSETMQTPTGDREDMSAYFPFATPDTSPLFEILLSHAELPRFLGIDSSGDVGMLLFDLFDEPFGVGGFGQDNFPSVWDPNPQGQIF
ncbi:uncharacterized protein Z519_01814 [Cladophialophora bantiana CBS 173.52]|uniref:Xylanolytic transcriptional activator regulatory domain-containing protein n=1 Tax=Cladophialophora bantiana (strain ATCC 10958 / CBS 173.52 / CDC B-1940 / NIH 8579) TaxID=1442370 RepID=A0A0D2I4M4_CLAB1|nr:uncharacterized protein Z519_01814 [Cladophialophora bantiana CBS 173.52]KIW98230.1 hypothetical protein Z519_01814 [Cladophialophora bantiana CBS 173.52]